MPSLPRPAPPSVASFSTSLSILCGDFNAVPYSEIYRLVHRGRLKYENLVSKDISGQQDDESLGLVRFVAKPLLPKAIGKGLC